MRGRTQTTQPLAQHHHNQLRPLNQVPPGMLVTVKSIFAEPELCRRLRELGIKEEGQIRLLLRYHDVVCEVCNVRLGLSGRLAEQIYVEPVEQTA